MLVSIFHPLFFFSLTLGVIISISSPTWFSAWIGLELNLLSFIPIIAISKNSFSSEASLKYFLIQALGSAAIIASASFMLISPLNTNLIIESALLLKLGAAPFHFWFPQVMEGLDWFNAILLMTIQKMAPMILISYTLTNTLNQNYLMMFALISSLIGAIGGINQTMLRKILAFSSINHMSWMLMSMSLSELYWFYYFIFYCIISSSIAILFLFQQAFHVSHLSSTSLTSLTKILTLISLLSLGGLPPFIGFFPKWLIIQQLALNLQVLPLTIMLFAALITLYYYLRIIITSLTLQSLKTSWYKLQLLPAKLFLPILMMFNLSSLLVIPSLVFF
uniref:NADH-ubiquinone oxidoreductase chain 2 n=1 Tax=Remiarctus bertholdii TaxID=1104393 RepID=A0A411ATV1_9EUCA|nr:NADH dehydrogenase subunit 2 [Remiarctus bertholdii]QAX91425.1 NADH dehydrogenase subunit 2 [Remiarctus bertholdii]